MTFPHTATIKRTVKNGVKYTYQTVGTTACFIQPLDAEKAQLYGVTYGKSSRAFLPYGADIQDSDRLEFAGVTYGVKGVNLRRYGGLSHAYALLEEL